MRLSQISGIIAELPGRDFETTYSKIRNPLFKALLTEDVKRSRNSPAEYSEEELIRAYIYICLAECGLTTQEMAVVNLKFAQPPMHFVEYPPSAIGVGFPNALRSAIRGTQASEEWFLRIRFTLTESGIRRVAPWVYWDGWSDKGADRGKSHDILYEETMLGFFIAPLSEMIRPLLAKIAK